MIAAITVGVLQLEPTVFIILIGFGLLIAFVAVIVIGKQRARRRQAMAELAAALGLSFDPARDYEHDDRYAHLEVFRRGSQRYAYNTLSGEMDLGGHRVFVVLGDFHYAVYRNFGESRQKKSYEFSYLIVQVPWMGVPDLFIRPETMFDRVGAMIGFDDIDFESDEFSRAFLVKSSDRKFAYDLIDPRMMEFLLETRPPLIDLEHGRVCLTTGNRRWSIEEFKHELVWLEGFFARWPEHLVRSLEKGPV